MRCRWLKVGMQGGGKFVSRLLSGVGAETPACQKLGKNDPDRQEHQLGKIFTTGV